jgi:hypothetical protein
MIDALKSFLRQALDYVFFPFTENASLPQSIVLSNLGTLKVPFLAPREVQCDFEKTISNE